MSVVQPPLSSDRSMSVMQPFLSGTVTDALSVVVSERPIKVFGWYENEFSYEKPVDAGAIDLMGVVKDRYLQVGLNHGFQCRFFSMEESIT